MGSNVDKKEAIRKFKEQKVPQGVYAVRCTANGHVWVGSSRNLDATRNRTWFTLRMGNYMDKSLQQEWNLHGEPAFDYEILEKLEDDLSPMAAEDLLKEKAKQWVVKMSANPLLPA
jgi:GIY-YIG catalytic domain